MLEANEPLRIAVKTALSATGIPVFGKKVNTDKKPQPTQYFLLTTQTKNRTEVSKDCFDWLLSINIECINIVPSGSTQPATVYQMEGQVINIIQAGIIIPNFIVKDVMFIDSVDLDLETPTSTIERRVIIYQYWVGQNSPQTT
jgi:hypothetical protein